MDIIKVVDLEDGTYLVNDTDAVQGVEIAEWLKTNTPDSLESYIKSKHRLLKREGEVYKGYQIPFMNDDALALMQVKSAFEMGVTSTNIEFTNGTVMPIQDAEFQEFAVWFVNKRNGFFT